MFNMLLPVKAINLQAKEPG